MSEIIPSEYQECVWLAEYLDWMIRVGKIKAYSHIPNSTFTKSWSVKIKNKKLGVSPGVPDYLIIGKDKIFFIEMKKTKGGMLSPHQKIWIAKLKEIGIDVFIAYGFEDAKKYLDQL